MLSRILMFGVNHRLATFLFLVAITCMAGLGLPKIRVETGFNSLLSNNDPDVRVYDRIIREFGSDNRTIIYVRDTKLWSPDKLAALEELHAALEGLEFVERVDDLFTWRTIRGAGGKLDSRLILPEAPKDQAMIDQALEEALYNPLVVGNILSRDGMATTLLISLREENEDADFYQRINATLEGVLVTARSVFQEVILVGTTRMKAEIKSALFGDLRVLGALTALVLAVVLLFFLRSVFAAWVSIVTAALSMVWSFGMMGWTGIPLNILGAMLPTLIIVIGSTGNVHMMASYLHGVSQAPEKPRAFATRFMIKQLGVSLILTTLITALGVASNLWSGVRLIQNFAMASTFAVLANGVITILFIPMVQSIMGPRRTRLYQCRVGMKGLTGLYVRLCRLSKHQLQWTLLLITAILCAFFIYQLSRLYVTNDALSYFKKDQPLLQDTQRIHQDLSGMKVFFITLESDADRAFQDPKNIEKLVLIQEFLKKQGIFDSSSSLADHLAFANREFHGGDTEYFKIPERRELVSQYLLFFPRRDLVNYVSHDFRRANIVVRHNVSDSKTLNRHILELREVVANFARGQITANIVGEDLMVNATADTLVAAQVISLAILLCVIYLIISAVFTSFSGGLICLIPNLIPIILMFGLMGFLGIPLNLGTVMVAVIVISMAIGGTMHLLFRYSNLCRRTSNYEEAMRVAIQEEATPMAATYLALMLGFGILLLSNFSLIAQFGALSAATMLFALLAHILITPISMSWVRLIGIDQIWSLSMHKEVLEKSPLFHGMSNYQMRKSILISELKEVEEGECLVKQGTFGRSMYLILTGEVEVVRRNEGKAQHLAVLGAGQVFGEIGYIKEIERTADVRALTHVEALRFDYLKLKRDLKFFPYIVANLNFNISCILGERLANAMGSMEFPPEGDESFYPDSLPPA